MKNAKKALAVLTAAAAFATTSAFAEVTASVTGDLTANFDYANSVLTVTAPEADDATEMTILVLDKEADATDVSAEDILYINQTTEGTEFGNMGLKVSELPVGTYPVKLGYYSDGAFAIANANIVVEEASSGKKVTILWGDTTCDGAVDIADAMAALYHAAGTMDGTYALTAEDNATVNATVGGVLWGDTTCDGAVDIADAMAALYHAAGTMDGTYTHDTLGEVTVNQNVEITLD